MNGNVINRYENTWQEFVDNYRTFAAEIACDIKQARELLDDLGGPEHGK